MNNTDQPVPTPTPQTPAPVHTAGMPPETAGSPVSAPSATPAPPPIPVPAKKKLPPAIWIIGGILLLGILIFGFLYIRSSAPQEEEAVPVITPTTIPTPTPRRNVSRIATTSAFVTFSEEIASFSATLNTFTLQDSTLTPPILDLELGLPD